MTPSNPSTYHSMQEYVNARKHPMSEKLKKDIEAGKRLGFIWVMKGKNND